ncbi:uncharacterized protein LOC123530224 isoform X2 [Mercenaria mercenaria]|uniref:uncharacterized protein LOC123530224 isoform X2 n=1 Tax=Mercenaria mercenaria TaxID=6596 RepID=UPI001E1D48A7|nr:uncharacterized protein LOC123530224 isoform X2 [Mercenaria mercenaria]
MCIPYFIVRMAREYANLFCFILFCAIVQYSNGAQSVLTTKDLEQKGWRLVFLANSCNNRNVYDAWVKGNGTTKDKPAYLHRTHGPHYRDDTFVSAWTRDNNLLVKFAFYDRYSELARVIFDGRKANANEWFHPKRVLASTYSDLTRNSRYDYFSIAGRRTLNDERRFFINRNYGKCTNVAGHIVVLDTNDKGGCEWNRHPVYPQFLYSKINSVTVWDRRLFGRADFMAIFVKTRLQG